MIINITVVAIAVNSKIELSGLEVYPKEPLNHQNMVLYWTKRGSPIWSREKKISAIVTYP